MQHRALIMTVLLLLTLLGAWYLAPAVLQASCSQDTMDGRGRGSTMADHLCPDHGVMQEGRDHGGVKATFVVCVEHPETLFHDAFDASVGTNYP